MSSCHMQQGARKARTLLQKLGRGPRCTGKSLYGTKTGAELKESFSFAEVMGKGHSRPGHSGENGTRLRRTRYPPPVVSTSENHVYHIWLFDKQSISYNYMERPPYTQFYFAFSLLVIFINKLFSNKKQGTRRKSLDFTKTLCSKHSSGQFWSIWDNLVSGICALKNFSSRRMLILEWPIIQGHNCCI